MIVYLQGKLFRIAPDYIVILTQGVGYQVFLSKPTLAHLPPVGSDLELHTHTVIREDSHQLFGFADILEKEIFLRLIQVNGVGPKLALTLLSGLPAEDLADAIRKEDLVRLTAISGIGKKTAERLIVDLKDKVIGLFGIPSEETLTTRKIGSSVSEEAVSALMNLGYSRQEAQNALSRISNSKELSLEGLVREGLKALS